MGDFKVERGILTPNLHCCLCISPLSIPAPTPTLFLSHSWDRLPVCFNSTYIFPLHHQCSTWSVKFLNHLFFSQLLPGDPSPLPLDPHHSDASSASLTSLFYSLAHAVAGIQPWLLRGLHAHSLYSLRLPNRVTDCPCFVVLVILWGQLISGRAGMQIQAYSASKPSSFKVSAIKLLYTCSTHTTETCRRVTLK